jgi:hypothetical protein
MEESALANMRLALGGALPNYFQGLFSGSCSACAEAQQPAASASVAHFLFSCPAWTTERLKLRIQTERILRVPFYSLGVRKLLGDGFSKMASWKLTSALGVFVQETVGRIHYACQY